MFSRYFGNFLLNRALVKPEELRDALDYQNSVRLKLGVLAINAGYMSVDQVMEVHSMQTKIDKKFGELAIELGYLNSEQLEELLGAQKPGHLLLGQAMMDKGYMTLEQFQAAMKEYKETCGFSEEQFNALQHGNTNEVVDVFVNFGELSRSQVYKDYISLLVRNIIRFLDESPMVDNSVKVDEYNARWLVYQEITGEMECFTAIAAEETMFLKIAEMYAGEEFVEPSELAQASVAEFLNLHNGIFLVNMSNNGVELEMRPQEVVREKVVSGLDTGYVVPIYFSTGKIDLIISPSIPTQKILF